MTIDPSTSFVAVPTLTEQSLVGEVFVSGLLAQGQDLSSAEQAVLFNFVQNGGAALIFGELDTFLNAANSMIVPFDMAFDGSLFQSPVIATITDPSHPIAKEPFGTVVTFTEAFVTSIGDLGSYGHSIATNLLGDTLAVIPRNAIAPGSGPVVVYSDSTVFINNNLADNEVLFKNTIAHLTRCVTDLDGDGEVGIVDFLVVLGSWGLCPPLCQADVDGDGDVGILDFLLVLADWGPCI